MLHAVLFTPVATQVTDTPGLLNRPDSERNKMEMLTLAALDYLPTYIVYVFDLTEECGTSAADQWDIRTELRQRYAGRAWIDVLSKADMLGDVFRDADAVCAAAAAGAPASAGAARPASVVDMCRELRGALRVSSVTFEGIREMQGRVVDLLSAPSS